MIVDESTDLILGAHVVGHASEELINIFGLAKAHGITASELKSFIFAYPSFSADIKHMLPSAKADDPVTAMASDLVARLVVIGCPPARA